MKTMKSKKVRVDELMTPEQVAEKSGKTVRWVRCCIQSETLGAVKAGGRYLITTEQYDHWITNPPPKGRPRKSPEKLTS